MERNCTNCGAACRIQYDGEVQKGVGCSHVAFFKAGMIRIHPETRQADVVEHQDHKDHPPKEKVEELVKDGYSFVDFLFQRNPDQRFCQHWNSGLRHLPNILYSEELNELKEWEPELVEKIQQGLERTPETLYQYFIEKYPFAPEPIKQWVKQGMPLKEKALPKLSKMVVMEYPLHEVPDETLLDYTPCASCHFFEPAKDSRGVLLTHKGVCKQARVQSGVFALSESTEDKQTYSFLSCSKFYRPKEYKIKEKVELSTRLLPFTEMNPNTVPLSKWREWQLYPNLDIHPSFKEEDFEVLKSKDLFGDAKRMHKSTNFAKMFKEMGNLNVLVHFVKGVKRTNLIQNEYWGHYTGYLNAEEALYGQVFTTPIPGVKAFANDPLSQEEEEKDDV